LVFDYLRMTTNACRAIAWRGEQIYRAGPRDRIPRIQRSTTTTL